ncbi:MAG: filamentous hemagglutinin family protein, partial [Gallionellaceae bacterium]|nr:filamentous hemagglutinin family protein [Gallionellaceae bacterium]
MNAHSYRLVFSKRLGMFVPVSEVNPGHAGKRRDRKARTRLALLVAALAAAPAWALDPSALPTGEAVKYGNINFDRSVANTLNINQTSQNGIIHWDGFNIGAQATVNFNQSLGVTSATLNRIIGNEASIIQGALNAPGAVYVINRNGILFDKGAQVNLHTLVASTLDIKDDALFLNGFLGADKDTAAFSDQYNSTGALDLASPLGSVAVAEDAYVASEQGGRIILMGADVTNQGTVDTHGGQIILAAGKKAYIHTPQLTGETSDSLLNGMVVVVESGGTARNLGTLAAGTGGDVSLIGAIVRQEGTATATTSVNVNGTIHLLAQYIDPAKPVTPLNNRPAANTTGEVVFGQGSHTAVMPALDAGKVGAAIADGRLSRQQVEDYYAGKPDPAAFQAYMPDDTIQDGQAFTRSKIYAQGRTVWVQEGASLVAPSGEITLFARNDSENSTPYLVDKESSQSFLLQYNNAEGLCLDCRLQVDAGAHIDVSGLRDVAIAMARNVVEVELRGSELADSPLLHGQENAFYQAMYGNAANPLYGRKIKVDIRDSASIDINGRKVTRQGTALADASGYIAQIGRRIDEKSTTGGTVNLYSEGGVVVRDGSTIDISGGSLAYQDGSVTTSQLLYKGRLYDIASATPDRLYSGLGADKTVFELGYQEGKDAGTLRVVAPVAALRGTVTGTTVTGLHQRGGTEDPLPRGGELILGFGQTAVAGLNQDYRLMSKVSFGASGGDAPDFATPLWTALSDEDKAALGRSVDLNPALREIVLDPARLKENGISRLSVYTNNVIDLAAGTTLDLGAGGTVSLTGAQIDIGGNIVAPGGTVALTSKAGVYTAASALVGLGRQTLDQHVAVAGAIRTAGQWSNDYLDRQLHAAYRPVVLDGGTIAVTTNDGGELRLDPGSLLDASAGGWLKADGKTLAGGAGGDIGLKAQGGGATLKLAGELRSYGLLGSTGKAGKGGALTVQTAQDILIGGGQAAGELPLDAGFFGRGGFSAYAVRSSSGSLSVADGTRLAPRTRTRTVSSWLNRQSGSDLAGFAQAVLLDRDHVAKAERPATDLSLSAAVNLTVANGAGIDLDSLAGLELSAGSIYVDGDLSAPGGVMTLKAGQPGGQYSPNVAIWLGPEARLSVAGIARTYRAGNGLIQGEVLDGGSLSLSTGGYLMVESGADLDASGALGSLDLPREMGGGTAYVRTALPSSGGTIRLAASEGLFVQEGAKLKANGGTAAAAAGTLQVELDRVLVSDEATIATYPVDPATGQPYPHRLALYADAAGAIPAYLTAPGTPLRNGDDASGVISLSQLANFDNLAIKAGNRIEFMNSMAIKPRGRLTIDAPDIVLGAASVVDLDAMYVNLGNGDPIKQELAAAATAGDGVLNVAAGLIDLTGRFALSGVKQASLISTGDVRLAGVADAKLDLVGGMDSAGDLLIEAAQVYATTLSEYGLQSSKADGTIRIAGLPDGQGGIYVPPVPLSGAGSVTVQADFIEQGGVLRAPLGRIVLAANKGLTLEDGSLTSVSAEGMAIPFGRVQNGRSWVYDFYTLDEQGNQSVRSRTLYSGDDGVVDLPAKEIQLIGTSTEVRPGAKVDLSGGGDLVGYEFAAGPGGSSNYLAQPGVFAIMPAANPAFAPADLQANQYAYLSANSAMARSGAAQSVQPGDTVYLSAIPQLGIKAGYYTLLPGQYALLPGAYAVRAVAGTTDMSAGQNTGKPDGSYLVAGFTSSLGDADIGVQRWSGFEVAGRDVVATNADFSFNTPAGQLAGQTLTGRSEITDYRVGQLLPDVNRIYDLALPKLAQDAGRLSINAGTSLRLDGQIDFGKPAGGLGGELDIASRKIAVTDGSAPSVADAGEYLVLDVAKLASYDVDSLMIGGTREVIAGDASSLKVNQVAEAVLVETRADNPLTAPEVMLVAKGSVTLAEGSQIRGEGEGGLKNETLVFGDADAGISGDGVLVRASSGGLRGVVRRNVSRTGNPADGLYTASDALVYGEKSVNLDATYTAFNLGQVGLGAKGALQLGATRVALGQVDHVLEGVFVTNEMLQSLGNPGEMVLKSYSNFDVYGDAALGSVDPVTGRADVRSLTLQGAGFAGIETGTLSIAADTVAFANTDGTVLDTAGVSGTGAIEVRADNILFGDGAVATAGFAKVDLVARGEIAGVAGQGGLKTADDLALTAQRTVGYNGSDMAFVAGGRLTTANYAAAGGEILPGLGKAPMGARLAFTGGQGIDHGGNIDLPAGWLAMTAENGDLNLLAGSQIFTGGVVRQFRGVDDYVNVYVAGGLAELAAEAGDVNIAAGAVVDVSGRDLLASGQSANPGRDGKGSADAGMLSLHASGNLNLAGELKGDIVLPDPGLAGDGAARRPAGGVLVVDAGSLTGGVTNLLNRASGFGREFSLRQRNGDLIVAAADTITAERVNLAADNGVLDIAGKIDARAPEGGWVTAAAGRELYLRDGAAIDARATGANQRGGEVWLLSGMDKEHVAGDAHAGALVLENGSAIDVAGTLAIDGRTTQSVGGRVHLQAPRLANGQDVRITESDGVYDNNDGHGAIGSDISGAALIEAIGNKVYEYGTVGSSQLTTIRNDSQTYMNTFAAAQSRLAGNAPGSAFHVRPGVEVRSAGDLIFSNDYDFGAITAVTQNQPGTLTLRAQGNLLINGNLSDGFNSATGTTLDGGDSWSYRLVAGADLAAADLMAVRRHVDPATGDFVLKGGKLVRTGTGAIQIAAAGDIEIGLSYSPYDASAKENASYNKASVIYSAGRADTTAGFAKPGDASFKAYYPVDGGSIDLVAGGSIRAPVVPELMNQWLVRRGLEGSDGSITTALTWGIDFRYFDQGVGALGGGNVRVRAGQDIENLSVSLPTTGRDYASQDIGTDILETAGGNLDVAAGGDIRSAVFYVQRGTGRVSAGEGIGAMPGDEAKNLLLALGDAVFQVDARTDLTLESAFNPTVVPMGKNVSSILGNTKPSSYFFTYGSGSGVDLVSAQGDIVLNDKMTEEYFLPMLNGVSLNNGQVVGNAYLIYPGSLSAAAVNGNLQVARSLWLYPSAEGQLHLFAAGDVAFGADGDEALGILDEAAVVTMSDQSIAMLSSVTNPGLTYAIAPDAGEVDQHASVPVHLGDADPVRIYAESGDIVAKIGSGLLLPKAFEMLAGQNIVNANVTAQNLDKAQTSTLMAGRDLRYTSPRTDAGLLQGNGEGIRIGGPGYLEVVAGRNIDLGTAGGIVSTGNLDNPSLGYGGADIALLAGMGTAPDADRRTRVRLPDYEAFLSGFGNQAAADYYAGLMDYERLRQALLDPANVALSYKEILNKLEQADYRAAMTAAARPEYERAVAAFESLLNGGVASARAKAARRLYYSELQQASDEASLMKQLVAMGFDLNDLNKADQPGVVERFNNTLAGAGLTASSLENFARFFARAGTLVAAKQPGDPGYDVRADLGYDGRAAKATGALLPDGNYAGDFNGFYSQVRTEQASDIDMLTPGGNVVVGLVNSEKVSGIGAGGYRPASETGLYTVNGGSLRSYSKGDFLVNTARVFTLGWEATLGRTPDQYLLRDDIFLYSAEGDVDAGKGAKTASSAPPPTFITDDKGYTKSDIGQSISGSGIGVLLVREVLNRGDTFLIAPNGEVNAGDAGIRASGNLFIDANRVVGADNIVAVGVSVGVPTAVDTSGLSVSGADNLGDAAKAASEATASLASSSEEAQKAAQEMRQALASFRP